MTDLRKMSEIELLAAYRDSIIRGGNLGTIINRTATGEGDSRIEILRRMGAAPSEGMNPRCPKCGSGLWITTEPSWAGKVICSSHCGFTAYPKRTEQHEHYYTFDHYAQFLCPLSSPERGAIRAPDERRA